MLAKLIVSTFVFAAALTACSDDKGSGPDGCTGHLCGGSAAITDPEGGNMLFEYIYFDTKLQAALGVPATVNRVMAYFENAMTPNANPLPTPGQCNNLATTKGWPTYAGSSNTALDVGTFTITGKNKAGADVTITVPNKGKGTDQIGRAHDIFYQVVNPVADNFLLPNSSYTVSFGGAGSIQPTTFKDGIFLADHYDVMSPPLEGAPPLVTGSDYTVHWTPVVSSNLPAGDEVLGATWLLDANAVPTHLCPTTIDKGQFTITKAVIDEFKAVATSRGAPTNKAVLLRNAIVHKIARLPNGDASNKRRIDMLSVFCWAQLVDVQ